MGLGLSTDANPDEVGEVVGKEYGFRVHHVEPNSPGAQAELQPILDYIVVANGIRLDKDDGKFVQMIGECAGGELRVCLFNTHTLRTRETTLYPNDTWGGNGLLGVTIRFDMVQPVDKHTLRVLDVYPASPASAAGLDAYNDYILCVGDRLFDGPDEFGEIVQFNCNRPVRLFVYSARAEVVRELTITPDRDWGGDGCLGCGVGAGYLHSLPRKRREQAPNALKDGTAGAAPARVDPHAAAALPTANGALTAVADAPTPFESAEAASTQGNVATTPSQDAGADAPPAAADVAAAGDDSLARGEGVDAAAADAREEAMDPSNQSTS
uniref:PDZ GRASP-type domain-containing protein n=1 Tax=Chrysotila carterae TaxID=13221 RepID=A0A7S4FC63_CHRCT